MLIKLYFQHLYVSSWTTTEECKICSRSSQLQSSFELPCQATRDCLGNIRIVWDEIQNGPKWKCKKKGRCLRTGDDCVWIYLKMGSFVQVWIKLSKVTSPYPSLSSFCISTKFISRSWQPFWPGFHIVIHIWFVNLALSKPRNTWYSICIYNQHTLKTVSTFLMTWKRRNET